MPTPVEVKVYIAVPNYRGYVQALQMYAPIVSPIGVTKSQIQQMLLSGLEVQHYEPSTKVYTKLTLQNMNEVISGVAVAKPVIEAPKETKPINGVKTDEPKMSEPEETASQMDDSAETSDSTADDPDNADATTTDDSTGTNDPEIIDESSIDWSSMTKAERRKMRAKLDAQKKAAEDAANETETSDTTPED